jgi:hypothetical protein
MSKLLPLLFAVVALFFFCSPSPGLAQEDCLTCVMVGPTSAKCLSCEDSLAAGNEYGWEDCAVYFWFICDGDVPCECDGDPGKEEVASVIAPDGSVLGQVSAESVLTRRFALIPEVPSDEPTLRLRGCGGVVLGRHFSLADEQAIRRRTRIIRLS